MAKPRNRSTLYRLIEAGQLAHRALLAPLLDRGLSAGDDALLLLLAGRPATTDAALAEQAGVPLDTLAPRIARLIERNLIARRRQTLSLTGRGTRLETLIAGQFKAIDDALCADLKPAKRKAFNKRLGLIAELLR